MKARDKIASIVLTALLLAACSGAPTGTHEGVMGSTLTFASGKATISLGNNNMQVDYSVAGDKIKLHAPDGGPDMILTRQSDGSLDTPWGHMTKK